MEKEQHVRHHRLPFLWPVLAHVGGLDRPAEKGAAAATDETGKAAFLAVWGLFTAVMFIGTLWLNRALQFVFLTLTLLFFLLAYGDISGAGPAFKHFTGYEGLVCGFSAMYAGLAQVLNELAGKTALPLGAVARAKQAAAHA